MYFPLLMLVIIKCDRGIVPYYGKYSELICFLARSWIRGSILIFVHSIQSCSQQWVSLAQHRDWERGEKTARLALQVTGVARQTAETSGRHYTSPSENCCFYTLCFFLFNQANRIQCVSELWRCWLVIFFFFFATFEQSQTSFFPLLPISMLNLANRLLAVALLKDRHESGFDLII